MSEKQVKLMELIDSLRIIIERLDEIIDDRMPLRFENDTREYSQEELQNTKEFLEKMRNQTIEEYYGQATKKQKANLGRLIR